MARTVRQMATERAEEQFDEIMRWCEWLRYETDGAVIEGDYEMIDALHRGLCRLMRAERERRAALVFDRLDTSESERG